jgi:uncharacterized integral membrane protein
MNEPTPAQSPTQPNPANKSEKSKVGVVWLTLAAIIMVLLLLIIFILQNSMTVHIKYFGAKGSLQFGVAMLIAAVAGALITLLVGSVRIIQLKKRFRLPR